MIALPGLIYYLISILNRLNTNSRIGDAVAETNASRLKNSDPNDPVDVFNSTLSDFGLLTFPIGLTNPGSADAGPYMEVAAFKYARSFRKSLTEQVLYKVYLPFPFQGVQFNNTVFYDPFNAIVGRDYTPGQGSLATAGAALLQGGASTVGGAAMNSITKIAGDAASKMNLPVDANQMKNQASSVFGLTFNPRMELAFNGNQLRTYNFSYILIPRNQAESKVIQDIIRVMEDSSYPDYADGLKVFLTYPDEFLLSFYNPDGTPIKGCPLVPDSFISNFGYAINPQSAGRVFPDGSPTSYSVSMTFSESNYLTRREIRALRNHYLPTA